jgi:Bacterial Ig-like domain (group 3)
MNAQTLRRVAAMGALVAVAAATSLTSIAGTAQAATPAPTRTTISSSTMNVVPGQAIKLKAVVKFVTGTAQPAGTVTFNEGATVLGSAPLLLVTGAMTAKITVPTLAFGPHSITATYGGSATAAASTSLTLVITVNKNGSTTVIVAVATATPGKWKLNARVKIALPGTGIPTGLVTYVIDGGAPQIVALNAFGKAPLTVTYAVGSIHNVTATYAGTAGIAASTGTLTFTA